MRRPKPKTLEVGTVYRLKAVFSHRSPGNDLVLLTGIEKRKGWTPITFEALSEDAMTGAIFTYRDLLDRVYCEEPLAKN
jgi:hypothetical protein